MDINMTLEDAIAEGRVYALNKSKPKGDILITFVQPSSGKSFVATIPKTWIPIDVTDKVPLQVIEESVDFRSYLRSKMLKLVPRKEAEKILNSPDADEEYERINTSKYTEDKRELSEEQRKADDTVKDYIKEENLLVQDILIRNEKSKASVTLNELKAIQEDLGAEDLVYVIQHTEGKIRAWAERTLKELDDAENA